MQLLCSIYSMWCRFEEFFAYTLCKLDGAIVVSQSVSFHSHFVPETRLYSFVII